MKAIQISKYGDFRQNLSIADDVAKPTPTKEHQILVKVKAVTLSPGDIRVSKGQCSLVQHPDKFPYIPGGDLCGTVVALGPKSTKFRLGDVVISQFKVPKPLGALAEFAVIDERWSVLKPKTVTDEQGASIATSALAGYLLVKKFVKKNDRVLIVGGSGGVGISAIQTAKKVIGASFVCAVSTQQELLQGIGADKVIDYTKENVWESSEYVEQPFDIVLDLVGGKQSWKESKSCRIVKNGKNGGRFTCLAMENPHPIIRNYFDMVKFGFDMMPRFIFQAIFPGKRPKYEMPSLLDFKIEKDYEEMVKYYEEGSMVVVVDSMFPFTEEGVKAAFAKQESRHAHGKVVVKVLDESCAIEEQ